MSTPRNTPIKAFPTPRKMARNGLRKTMPHRMAFGSAFQKDGRWEAAYDSSKNMEVPADFLSELKKNKKPHEFFKALNKTNKFAIAFRLHTAKRS
jgi:uncharacterized protein YdeI (YjbR/CyaY-like superfamily)